MTRYGTKKEVGLLLALPLLVSLLLALLPSSAAAEETPSNNVLVIGVPGLLWQDISQENTPSLWELASRAATGSLSTRTTKGPGGGTCPAAGWLTLSAGESVTNMPFRDNNGNCFAAAPVAARSDTAEVTDVQSLQRANDATLHKLTLGLLGDTLQEAEYRRAAVGKLAVLGAADSAGHAASYAAKPRELSNPSQYQLITANVNGLISSKGLRYPLNSSERTHALTLLDERIKDTLALATENTTVFLVGLSDHSAARRMHVAMATGPEFDHSYLTSTTTRTDGLVSLVDLTATVLTVLDLEVPSSIAARPWHTGGSISTSDTEKLVQNFVDTDLAGRSNQRLIPRYFMYLLFAQFLLYAGVTFTLSRWRTARAPGTVHPEQLMRKVIRPLSVFLAACLPAALLANALPWAHKPRFLEEAMLSQVTAIIAVALLLTGCAYLGWWRRHPLGPLSVISGATLLAVGADITAHFQWQADSPVGFSPLTGGRFFGLGNSSFALISTAAMLSVAVLAYLLRAHRRSALIVCAALFAVLIGIVGTPSLGADFGGVIALLPAALLTLALLARWRITLTRTLIAAGSGVAAILVIAGLDALRAPSARSHLGAFVADLFTDEGRERSYNTIARKTSMMVSSFENPLTMGMALTGIAALLLIYFWLPQLSKQILTRYPTLLPAIAGIAVIATLGVAINDTGVIVASVTMGLSVPLLFTVLLTEESAVSDAAIEREQSMS